MLPPIRHVNGSHSATLGSCELLGMSWKLPRKGSRSPLPSRPLGPLPGSLGPGEASSGLGRATAAPHLAPRGPRRERPRNEGSPRISIGFRISPGLPIIS